ncbi:MAG: META domain-containing protein [Candidatus Delongbacteria bacterium]|nr:META domain-containing protein [Candidatus Delongbacteria bacterium]MBN2836108.1 META domain-containing protein [Candidatus Delongbacteria bacterium]
MKPLIFLFIFFSFNNSKLFCVENLITEKYWRLIELNNKEIVKTKSPQKEIYMILKEDGKIIGFSGCNSFQGEYHTDMENRLKINNLITTRMMCPEINLENIFTKRLGETEKFHYRNDTLTIFNLDSLKLAKFKCIYLR